MAFFETDDERLVFFFKRLSGKSSHSARVKILDTAGNDLRAWDDDRESGYVSRDEGLFREWVDEIMSNEPKGYYYPIRRGYRGKLRFKYSWDYVDEKQNIVLDLTMPWRVRLQHGRSDNSSDVVKDHSHSLAEDQAQ